MNITILLILLGAGALATYGAGNKWAPKVALGFSILTFICALTFVNQHNSSDFIVKWFSNPNVSFAIKSDGLALTLVLLTTALVPIILLTSLNKEIKNAKSFYALVLFMAGAMVGTFLAADGFLYYIFWELALLPIFMIGLFWGDNSTGERKKTMMRFFVFTFAGSLFMLGSFIYLYQKVGSFYIADLYKSNLNSTEQFWVFLGFFIAYAIKIPILPFHSWQAKTYQFAPTVGTMLLSGAMLKMGLYSVIRWQMPIAPLAAKEYGHVFIWLSLAGVVYGSLVALKQDNLKKLMAYSSLAHVGLIAAACYSGSQDAITGAVYQMVGHGFVIVGLFYCVDIIHSRYKTIQISDLGGIRTLAPKFTSLFLLVLVASIGLPGTFNFIGEFTMLYGLGAQNISYAVVGGTSIILGAYYMLKMFQNTMLGTTQQKPFDDVSWSEGFTLILIIGVLFYFGMYPKPLHDLIAPSIAQLNVYINPIK